MGLPMYVKIKNWCFLKYIRVYRQILLTFLTLVPLELTKLIRLSQNKLALRNLKSRRSQNDKTSQT